MSFGLAAPEYVPQAVNCRPLPTGICELVGVRAIKVSVGRDCITVRDAVTECDNAPDIPVMVRVYVPGATELQTLNRRLELPVGATVAGVNRGVTPFGYPETDSEIFDLKPLIGLEPATK